MQFTHQMRCYHFFIVEIIVESVNLIQMSKGIRIITMIENSQVLINPTQDGPFRGCSRMGGGSVHFTSWKHSTSWKFGLYFVYIFTTDWNFSIKFCSSDPSFNRNTFRPLYLKFKTFAHAQIAITHYEVLFTNFLA